MTNRAKLQDWTLHGSRRTDHGFLPERGVHYVCGPDDAANMAITAALAVAVAAGDAGGGLSEPDQEGVRRALGGFFGKAVGCQGAVAVLTTRKAAMQRAIDAAALARGVTAQLPIFFAAPRDGMAGALATGEFRLPALRDAMGDPLLVIVDGLSASPRSRHDVVRGLTALESALACAVFVVAREPIGIPSAHESSTLAVADGVVTFHPAAGEGWACPFTLDRIRLLDGEALAVRPGEAVALVPKVVKAPAKSAEQIVRAPKIVQRIVFALTGERITEAERARWPEHRFVTSAEDAVKAVQAASADGVTEIAVVASHRGGDVRTEARRVTTALHSANLTDFAVVRVSDLRLLDPHAIAA